MTSDDRQFPVLPAVHGVALEPISFIVVHFCGDYNHNILRSACIFDPRNELVRVDNQQGHRYDTLSAAVDAGLGRATHDLVAVVHEDVVLVDNWQETFQQSLNALEAADPDWGLAGAVGWDEDGRAVGHYSDPKRYMNILADRAFAPVRRLDEQLLVFRRSKRLRFDPDLPSIHNLGRDLASGLKARGHKSYALNAPTIHKFADDQGHPITERNDSPKIRQRYLPANLAEWADSDEYLLNKWPEWSSELNLNAVDLAVPDELGPELEPPVILLSRGGSGSRLLSAAMTDLGVFLGNEVNTSGDCMEMVQSIYRAVLSKYQRRAGWQRGRIVPRLRAHARAMLEAGRPTGRWGFKLPENLLILPDLEAAFPGARYVHLIRDPRTTCLRRTHMTARFDNAIGRTAIRAAYHHCGVDVTRSLTDSPAMHMALTTRHQLEVALDYARDHLAGRYDEVFFEDALHRPGDFLESLSTLLGEAPRSRAIEATVQPGRAANPKQGYSEAVEAQVEAELAGLRARLGYLGVKGRASARRDYGTGT